MNESEPDSRESILAELLLYHAVLGRGYVNPFPKTRGLIFTSAAPDDAMDTLAEAETSFRRWHTEQLAPERQFLAQMEEAEKNNHGGVIINNKERIKEVRERLSRRPHVTWSEDQVTKSTLTELLKTHYYGSFTYLDPVGARIGSSLCGSSRLAGDLGWTTLMEGTTDEAFIRAASSGGALIHSLTGMETTFNHYSRCKSDHIDRLRDRIRNTPSGQVGQGTTILLPGTSRAHTEVQADTLFALLTRVFALGAKPLEDRVRVVFSRDSRQAWEAFLDWKLPQLLNDETPANWQIKIELNSPTSVRTSVLFAARAALTMAFIQHAQSHRGDIREIELNTRHLAMAMKFARILYVRGSGHDSFERRTENLKDPRETFTSPKRLEIAKRAIFEALEKADRCRLSRTQIRREVPGATLGLLDILVSQGVFVELRGTEECQMGKTKQAYTLPKYAPKGDEEAAVAEYEEALLDFENSPEAFPENDALAIGADLREKAEIMFSEHFMPVVPLSRMTKGERRMLPKLIEMFPGSFRLRGNFVEDPEPKSLTEDDDTPLDTEGINLWVRNRKDGTDFCDWSSAGRLALGDKWAGAETENAT